MSAPYRDQISQSLIDAAEVLEDPKSFPVPIKGPEQSNTQFLEFIRSNIKTLDSEQKMVDDILNDMSSAHSSWMALRISMTGNERIQDNAAYDAFTNATPYIPQINNLKRYTRALTKQRNSLEAILPQTSQTSSYAHLPRMDLPKFTGKCTDFISFMNQFNASVGDLPTLSESIKLSYLKTCLSGEPLSLINSLPLTDQSYIIALNLLTDKYGNKEEITRNLHQSLKSLPIVRKGDNFCKDLNALVNSFEALCIQFQQQGNSVDGLHIQMEVESKLPPFLLEEIFRAKEVNPGNWTTESLRSKLKAILKRKQDVSAVHPEQSRPKNANINFKPQSSSKPNDQPFFQPQSSLTFFSQNKFPKPNFSPKPPFSANLRMKLPCIFCNKFGHYSSSCHQFPDLTTRSMRLRELKRCFLCLKNGHFSNKCPQPTTCTFCEQSHPRALCPSLPTTKIESHLNPTPPRRSLTNNAQQIHSPPLPSPHQFFQPRATNYTPLNNKQINPSPNPPVPLSNVFSNQDDPNNSSQTNVSSTLNLSGSILLKCVRAHIFNPDNPSLAIQGIVLLDDASTNSYIHFSKAKELHLNLTPTSMNLGVFNNPVSQPTNSFLTKFGLHLVNGRSLIINANTLNHLTQPTRHIPFSPELLSYSSELIFHPETVVPIVLLGSDYYYDVEPTPIMKMPSGYTLVHTLLGPIVAGKPYNFYSQNPNRITNVCLQEPNPPSDFFTLEGIGITDEPISPSEQDAALLERVTSEISIVDGRYEVKLPFKTNPRNLHLPSNFGLCWGRLLSVFNSLKKDNNLLNKYNNIIKEQQNLGIIEIVKTPSIFNSPLHYLAHHPVIQHAKNKVRIVFDGSARSGKSLSLNDCLYPGPSIVPELVGILIRFRVPPVAIICDVEKAFLQVSVHPKHRDVMRFLWVKNTDFPPSRNNMQIFRFFRVTFGLAPSPFLLAATIRFHLSKYSCPLSKEIGNNIYVDNIFIAAQTTKEGEEKCFSLSHIFKEARMKVREFASNSSTAIEFIPNEDKLQGHSQKFLGVNWNTDSDYLSFNLIKPQDNILNKRSVLAFIASHYDPLGLISPIILPLKLFMQTLWQQKLNWDQKLPETTQTEWNNLLKRWDNDDVVRIPRKYFSFNSSNLQHEIHCFSDASSYAMCAAVFLRTYCISTSLTEVSLIFSKTKIKPITKRENQLTIPRLELIAAVLGSKSLIFVNKHLNNLKLNPILNLWTDSSAVLAWLNSTTEVRDVFVQNRLNSIRSLKNLRVRHLPGADNPADLGSRGIGSLQELSSTNIWWKGPTWLSTPSSSIEFPFQQFKEFLSNNYSTNPQPTVIPFCTFNVITTPLIEPIIDISRFSRLPRLINSTVFFLRFIFKIKPTCLIFARTYERNPPSHYITIAEIRFALHFLIRQEQQLFPPPDKDNEALGLFTDEKEIIRSKGRLGNSLLPLSTQEPIYLPPQLI
ncbi:hypothetical protein ACQ4LE_000847 [Meloidogyne hapla]